MALGFDSLVWCLYLGPVYYNSDTGSQPVPGPHCISPEAVGGPDSLKKGSLVSNELLGSKDSYGEALLGENQNEDDADAGADEEKKKKKKKKKKEEEKKPKGPSKAALSKIKKMQAALEEEKKRREEEALAFQRAEEERERARAEKVLKDKRSF